MIRRRCWSLKPWSWAGLCVVAWFFGLSAMPVALAEGVINPRPLEITKVQFAQAPTGDGEDFLLEVFWHIEPPYTAYLEKFNFRLLNQKTEFTLGEWRIAPVHTFFDTITGQSREGTSGQGRASVWLKPAGALPIRPGLYSLSLELSYQACTKKHCLFPSTEVFEAPLVVQMQEGSLGWRDLFRPQKLSAAFDQALRSGGWWWLFVLVFLAGFLTSLTPCVLPMLPVTLLILKSDSTRARAFLNSVFYVLGMGLTYSVLGVLAASMGVLFGSLLSHPLVLVFICACFFAMGLNLLGVLDWSVFSNNAPTLDRALAKLPQGLRFFVMGMGVGLVASPCVGPVLVSVLIYIGTTQNLLLGFALMFVFSLGLGLLFVVYGSLGGSKFLLRPGAWMGGLKKVLGVSLLGVGVFFAWPWVSKLWPTGPGVDFAFSSKDHTPVAQKGVPWQDYTDQKLYQALQNKRLVVIDVFASWCVACVELEQKTFTHPDVVQFGAEYNVLWLKVNATKSSAKLTKFKKRYNVVGLPWVMFYDAAGRLRPDLRLTGFVDAAEFLSRLKQAAKQAAPKEAPAQSQ